MRSALSQEVTRFRKSISPSWSFWTSQSGNRTLLQVLEDVSGPVWDVLQV